jgi:hypothetical protein
MVDVGGCMAKLWPEAGPPANPIKNKNTLVHPPRIRAEAGTKTTEVRRKIAARILPWGPPAEGGRGPRQNTK